MLIEQIIKFEVRKPGPPGRTCTPITDYFNDKTKIYKENFRVDYTVQQISSHKKIQEQE